MTTGPSQSQASSWPDWRATTTAEPAGIAAETTWMAPDEAALYESGSWRASNHDPEVVGLELAGGTVTLR